MLKWQGPAGRCCCMQAAVRGVVLLHVGAVRCLICAGVHRAGVRCMSLWLFLARPGDGLTPLVCVCACATNASSLPQSPLTDDCSLPHTQSAH